MHWNEPGKGWLVTRYADVSAAFFDPRLSSARAFSLLDALPAQRRAVMGPVLELLSRWMVVNDPPVHTRLRTLANAAFRRQRVAAMGEWITEVVDELLDDLVDSGTGDFLNRFALPLPANTICRMMGVPEPDIPKFSEWSEELGLVAFGAGGADRDDRHARALAGLQEMDAYLHGLVERCRRHPGADMVSLLVRDQTDGDSLSDDEVSALCALILLAGHETTTNLLCSAVVTLCRHPEQLELLRGDPSLTNGAVEEVLRYDGPVKILTRWVSEDTELNGRRVAAGQRVLLALPAANRDGEVFADPDVFDIRRPTQPLHIGFGRGIHGCMGSQLARLEARIALPRILDRLPGLALEEVAYQPSFASRAMSAVTVSV